MKIRVAVKPGSKRPSITMLSPAEYVVAVREPPIEGRANEAVIRALAEHFDLPPSHVLLVAGRNGKRKVFDIPLTEQQLPTAD